MHGWWKNLLNFYETELMSIWIEITWVYREGAELGRFYYLTQDGRLVFTLGHSQGHKKKLIFLIYGSRDVLFEYHRAVVPFSWAVRPVRSCLPSSRLLTGIQILAVFQNLRWNSIKTSL